MSGSLTARRVKETREYLALSLAEAATAAGISEDHLRRIEGCEQMPDELSVQRLARIFGCVPAYLTNDPVEDETTVEVLARVTDGLTERDRLEARRFATYLRHAVDG
jgi:transcriptional regulator with XRE-family HTH domain